MLRFEGMDAWEKCYNDMWLSRWFYIFERHTSDNFGGETIYLDMWVIRICESV